MRLNEFINEKIYRSKRSDGYLRNRRYFSAISKNKQPEVKKIEPKQLDLFKGVSESLIEEISTLTEKMFLQINQSGVTTNHKQRKSLRFIQVHMPMHGQQRSIKLQVVAGEKASNAF